MRGEGETRESAEAVGAFRRHVPAVRSIAAVKAWEDPRWDLAGFEPLYAGLRQAGFPD